MFRKHVNKQENHNVRSYQNLTPEVDSPNILYQHNSGVQEMAAISTKPRGFLISLASPTTPDEENNTTGSKRKRDERDKIVSSNKKRKIQNQTQQKQTQNNNIPLLDTSPVPVFSLRNNIVAQKQQTSNDDSTPSPIIQPLVDEFTREEIEKREKKEILKKFNKRMKRLYDEGIAHRERREYDKAIKKFENIINAAPRNITGYNSRGFTNMGIAQQRYLSRDVKIQLFRMALEDFKICVNISPFNEVVLLNKAKSHLHLSDLLKNEEEKEAERAKALIDYETLIKILPDDSRGYNGKGVCLRKFKLNKESLDYFSKGIELHTHPREPLINRAMVYLLENKPINSIVDFQTLYKDYASNEREANFFKILKDRNVNQIKRNSFFPNNPTMGWDW